MSTRRSLGLLDLGAAALWLALAVGPVACTQQAEEPDSSTEQNVTYDPLGELQKAIQDNKIDLAGGTSRTEVSRPPQVKFDPAKTYTWKLETSEGTVSMRLMPDVAPMHCSSTVYLTLMGFYDDLGFHRIIPGFMAQGGCPMGTGSGGPAYKYNGEFDKSVRHDKGGLLSMANAGPGTDGSQFFLTFVATPWLDDKHTIFGECTDAESLATLKKMEALGTPNGRPTEQVKLIKATIEES